MLPDGSGSVGSAAGDEGQEEASQEITAGIIYTWADGSWDQGSI